jgi:hypothetical protein
MFEFDIDKKRKEEDKDKLDQELEDSHGEFMKMNTIA